MNLIANFCSIKRQLLVLAAAVAMLVLASCNPAPNYAKPPAPTPSAFKEAPPEAYKEGAGWKLAQPGDDKIGGQWWTLYKDPQLSALEEQVAVSNQTIKQAEANFRASRSLVVSARSALFPTVSASPSYSNSRISSTTRGTYIVGSGTTTTSGSTTGTTGTTTSSGGTTAGTTTGTTGTTSGGTTTGTTTAVGGTSTSSIINTFSVPLDISYTVDLWHKVRNQIAANSYSAQASAADIGTAALSIHSTLAQDYFEIRALDAQRQILEDTLANYRQTLELTKTLFNAGIDSEEEVVQAQTQVDTTTAQLTDLGVARSTYEHAIAVLIGKPPAEFSLAPAPFLPQPPEIPLAQPSELLERRPDIAATERLVASANATIGVARAAYYPNLTLSASGGFETSHFLQWFNWPSRFWSLGPSLADTLYEGGARRAATEQAEANYDSAVANYRQTVLTAFQAVEDNLSTLRILAEEVRQEQTAVNSASRYLDLSLTRFKAGVDSYLNVITAQNTLLTNRETELQIQLRQMTASVQLVMALGGGWDTRLPNGRELLAKPPKWQPASATPAAKEGPNGSPNPPPLPANFPVPNGPQGIASSQTSTVPAGK